MHASTSVKPRLHASTGLHPHEIFECAHLEFTVGGWSKQASIDTRVQCCHASVGLAQARPNYKYMCKIFVWQYLVLFPDHHPHFARRGLAISLTGYSPSAVNLSCLGTYVCTIKPKRTYCRLISVCAYDKHVPTHVISRCMWAKIREGCGLWALC